jgi:hypothetical protein
MKRMTFRHALEREPTSAPGAVQAQAFGRVARTGRVEAADRSEQRRQGQLVDANQKDQDFGYQTGLSA